MTNITETGPTMTTHEDNVQVTFTITELVDLRCILEATAKHGFQSVVEDHQNALNNLFSDLIEKATLPETRKEYLRSMAYFNELLLAISQYGRIASDLEHKIITENGHVF